MNIIRYMFAIGVLFFAGVYTTYAEINRFDVSFNRENVILGEALDMTISAVDVNGEIVTDFTGEILVFSESDPRVDFPSILANNAFEFSAEDEGSVKFENAIFYKSVGNHNMFVYLLTDEQVMGQAVVDVLPRENTTAADIVITTPEDGLTIGKNTMQVTGVTEPNHQVRIFINEDEKDVFTSSDNEGFFEKEITSLANGKNTFQARVYNKDDEVIGTSEAVNIQVQSEAPEFKNITITPTGEVEAETKIFIEVVSNTGLQEVHVMIQDTLIQLTEEREGRYTVETFSPSLPGTYSVDALLKNDFNIETRMDDVAQLIVLPKLLVAEENPSIIERIDTTHTPSLDLTIQNIRITELKERSIITWDALPDAEEYNIYRKISDTQIELIDTVKTARYEIPIVGEEIQYDYFAIKAIGKTHTGSTVQGDLSDMIRVQTGPELYILLFFLALLITGGIFMVIRKQHI